MLQPNLIEQAESVTAQAQALARLGRGGAAWAVLAHPCQLPDSPLAHLRDAAGSERTLLWWRDSWMLGVGVAYSSAVNGPGRTFHMAEAAAGLDAASVVAVVSPNGERPPPGLPAVLCLMAFEDRPGLVSTPWGRNLPGARLVLPRRLYWRQPDGSGWIVAAVRVDADSTNTTRLAAGLLGNAGTGLDDGELMASAEPGANMQPWPAVHAPPFQSLVADALASIAAGEFKKVVLARAVDEALEREIDPAAVLARLHAGADPTTVVYAHDLEGGALFLGATPELLFAAQGNRLHTMALAGSTGRGNNDMEDTALGLGLIASVKERQEHSLVVEHLVGVLRGRARPFAVPATPSLRKLSRVQHLQTTVSCELEDGDYYDVLSALHPTPAVCGLPTEPAREFLRRRESLQRGLYTGAIGYVTRTQAEMVVPLRGGIIRGDVARIFAGAGVVANSDPQAEYVETELKLRVMRNALGLDG